MTNKELIEAVKCLQVDFEAALKLNYMLVRSTGTDDRDYYKAVRRANDIRGLYEGALRLAKDRGISMDSIFDYKEERM